MLWNEFYMNPNNSTLKNGEQIVFLQMKYTNYDLRFRLEFISKGRVGCGKIKLL